MMGKGFVKQSFKALQKPETTGIKQNCPEILKLAELENVQQFRILLKRDLI